MRRPICFDGAALTAVHEMWCTFAITTTTSNVPMRPPTCFDRQARAVADGMLRTTATTATFLRVLGSLSKVAATFNSMCIDAEPGMRTAAAVAWEAAAKITLLVLAVYLLDGGCCSGVYCISTDRVLQQHVHRLLLLLLRALQQHEEVVVHRKPSDGVVGGSGLCE